jgi:hypothetical protein
LPTNRVRRRREVHEPLSEYQRAVLLALAELPPETPEDTWWRINAAGQTNPHKAWYNNPRAGNCVSAIVLWARFRDELLPEWRRLHGRRRPRWERAGR